MSDHRPGVRPLLEVVRDDEHAAQLAAKHKAGYSALSAFTSANGFSFRAMHVPSC